MKKITTKPIKNVKKENRNYDGKVHIVESHEETKPLRKDSSTLSIKSDNVNNIHDLHSKENLLDNTVAFGNKTGWRNGDVSDRINDHLVEKGYEP